MGPEAMGIDVFFPNAMHVYGLPERATRLSLRPTVDGETGQVLTEPYR